MRALGITSGEGGARGLTKKEEEKRLELGRVGVNGMVLFKKLQQAGNDKRKNHTGGGTPTSRLDAPANRC